jgi:hypothetical protein
VNAFDVIDPPSGHFLLEVRRKGLIVPELCMDERNLIVAGSKTIMAHLLGGTVTGNSITQIAYGTSGAAATTADTAITGAFTKAHDGASYPVAGQVQFAFSLGSAEDNPMNIFEFGLVTAAGALFSRKVRSVALSKDVDLSFSGTWTITF